MSWSFPRACPGLFRAQWYSQRGRNWVAVRISGGLDDNALAILPSQQTVFAKNFPRLTAFCVLKARYQHAQSETHGQHSYHSGGDLTYNDSLTQLCGRRGREEGGDEEGDVHGGSWIGGKGG